MANENVFLKYIKNLKGKWTLLLLSVVGIALLIAGKTFSTAKTQAAENQETTINTEEYRKDLEKRLAEICEKIEGCGNVSVMITMECGEEYVYAANSDGSKSNYVTYSGEGILLRKNAPRVRGVAVICDGGDNPEVKLAISNSVSALLDIGTNHISVEKRI